MTFDPTFVYGNYVEACVWAAMGIVALAKRPNRWAVWLGVTLIVFGGSDVVEASTGAWYDPWWLLAWKAACIALICVFGAMALRANRRASPRTSTASSDADV